MWLIIYASSILPMSFPNCSSQVFNFPPLLPYFKTDIFRRKYYIFLYDYAGAQSLNLAYHLELKTLNFPSFLCLFNLQTINKAHLCLLKSISLIKTNKNNIH